MGKGSNPLGRTRHNGRSDTMRVSDLLAFWTLVPTLFPYKSPYSEESWRHVRAPKPGHKKKSGATHTGTEIQSFYKRTGIVWSHWIRVLEAELSAKAPNSRRSWLVECGKTVKTITNFRCDKMGVETSPMKIWINYEVCCEYSRKLEVGLES